MKVIVIGSGLIGLTTAYFLTGCGHEVIVIDRQEGPGRETSFANAALLTPSMSDPWNAPGCWRVLLASLCRSDAPLQLRLRTLPALSRWGVRFLRNSRAATFRHGMLSNVHLALYSLKVMKFLRQHTNIDYGRIARGSLRLFRDKAALDRAYVAAERLLSEGLSFRRLSAAETVEFEPSLAPIARQLGGSIHYLDDEIGDAHKFCVILADYLRRQGVKFCFGTQVRSFEMRSSQVTAVMSAQERFVADRYVVAAGSYSTPLLRKVGLSLPVQPAKGYSITFDDYHNEQPLTTPVVDDGLHAAVVPLGAAIRIAGTAEFAGYDLTMNPARISNLIRLLRNVLPQAQLDPTSARPWCGLRPMSVDGVPIIGSTPISNLLVNTGHGPLGWTMAAGSAQLLADLMCGDSPSIDPAPFALERFARA